MLSILNQWIPAFILIPVAGYILSICIPGKKENILSVFSFSVVGLHLFFLTAFTGIWIYCGAQTINHRDIVLYQFGDYEFYIDLLFDKITAVYAMAGSFLTFLVTVYSRYYMHREKGYKRFFNTIMFFFIGYNITIFAGNLETLFIGWEILGVSSFLLIAFYRERYLPVKNAVKVFSIYRIGDVGIILAMWMSHHLWHSNITFLQLRNYEMVHEHIQNHSAFGVFISLMILLTAAAKSAQLPFTSWLPRAMEGPTPSSAIFYGSLSVHLGAFLLMRTFPLWEYQQSVRILIGLLGFCTALVSNGIARVQSSVKSQIAYGSAAQIGIIFVELALGFENIALFHFAGNAFLRTYQLLVSPSVVSYLIREQFYNFIPRAHTFEDSIPRKVQYSFYILCLKEFNLDSFMYRFLWNPFKRLGRRLEFLSLNRIVYILVPVYIVGLFLLFNNEYIPVGLESYLPTFFAIIGFVMVVKAFTERHKARFSWITLVMNHYWVALAISFNEHFRFEQNILYLSGVTLMGVFGYICLLRLRKSKGSLDLNQFHGHIHEHPKLGLAFLLACLGVTGFPITPTFVGEDVIFSHIHENQPILATLVSLSFIIDGISTIRIYARLFLGAPVQSVFDTAYRSS